MKASELRKALSLVTRLKELREFLVPFVSGAAYHGEPDPDDRFSTGNYMELHVNGRGINLYGVADDDVKTIIGIVEKHHAAQLERVKAAGIEDDTP